MPQFLIDHLEGCTPANQCASCRAMTILKKHLPPAAYKEFAEIAASTTGKTIEGGVALSTPWKDVLKDLTFRVRRCLEMDRIETLYDILQLTKQEMFRRPNFGKKSMKELEESLAKHRLYFGMKLPSYEEVYPNANVALEPGP